MRDVEVHEGLEGVVAFATEIAEPDRDGGALRYRGVDVEELVGAVPFERVWGLLVDGRPDRPMLPADPHPLTVRTGDARVDVQSALAALAPEWGLAPSVDLGQEVLRDQLGRVAAATLSFVAQSARGGGARRSPRRRSTRARPWPSASSCGGEARSTPTTPGRSTRTGSPRPSTG